VPHRLGPVGRSMLGKPARERARLAARALAKEWRDGRRLGAMAAWEVGGVAVSVGDVADVDGVLVVNVEVRDGQGALVRFSNPLVIVNPRILVGTGEYETIYNEDGSTDEMEICEENPGEALRLMVLDAVRRQL